MRKIVEKILCALLITNILTLPCRLRALDLLQWDFPEFNSGAAAPEARSGKSRSECLTMAALPKDESAPESFSRGELAREPNYDDLPVLYPSAEFDPILGVGMILVISVADHLSGKMLGKPQFAKIRSDEVVSIPGLGPLAIVGKKLSAAAGDIRKFTGQGVRVGLMMGDVHTVQVLGKVQKPGNYPGDLPLSAIIAEAMDRAPGSNFKVSFFNGANRQITMLRYEDIVKGKNNPLVPSGSVLYFPPSAGAIFGEMTEKQINLAYLVVITISALGITALAK